MTDNVSRLYAGIKLVDQDSEEIRTVVTRVMSLATTVLSELFSEETGKIQLDSWDLYCSGMIRQGGVVTRRSFAVVFRTISGGAVLVYDDKGYHQPKQESVAVIRKYLPEFLDGMLEKFPTLSEVIWKTYMMRAE